MPRIRAMQAQDKDQVYRIEVAAFPHPWPEEAFEADSAFDRWLICESDAIIGYIFCHSVLDECSILNFAIDPAYQGRGFGKKLLEYALGPALDPSVRYIYLDVRASNIAARHLYENFGFKAIGIRRHYYSHPDEDSLVMQKVIQRSGDEGL